MDWLVAAGSFCLGIVVGWLVAYYVEGVEKMDHRVLYSAAGVLGGTGVITLFHLMGSSGSAQHEYWMYPIGLLIGFIIGTAYEYATGDYWIAKKTRTKLERK